MKAKLVSFGIITVLSLGILKAQNEEHKFTICINTGVSLAGNIVKLAAKADPTATIIEDDVSPAYPLL